ncbi:MAG: hypothetical protein HOW73_47890 [Polyangiaceae bacterium]|nr:hypothetical protein [Polyangiaceae bacterium]
MSTIALISDQHFDRSSRWEEHLRIMSWIVAELRENRPATILLGGDLFERKPTPEEMRAAIDWVRELADIAEVVGVYGNHDVENSLYPLTKLDTRHPVTIYAEPAVHETKWGAIACLPWPRRAQLLASIGAEVDHETANQIAFEALQNVLRWLGSEAESRAEGGARVLLSHCQVRGARVSTGQPLAPGADFELGLEDLALARADAYLFGHIHRRTEDGEWTIAGAPALYAGSPRRTAFGEVETKSYALVDVSKRPVWVDLVETPCAPMLLLEETAVDGSFPGGPLAHYDGVCTPRGAEIRFRYTVESQHRDAARADAEHWRKTWLECGAVSVKLEEVVRATLVARAPEIARATTLDAKLDALWKSRDVELDDERRARVFDRLRQIEDAERKANGSGSGAAGGSVRFEAIRARRIGVLQDVDVDLTRTDGILVAVCGENGAGKSTFLETMMGAVTRRCPTRGPLGKLATGRDSVVEARVVNGAPWTIRHLLDSVSGAGESLVLDGDGRPAFDSAKRKAFDGWAERNLPAPEVLLASTFAAQSDRGFLEMSEGERKQVLLKVLGVDRLEALAELARAQGREAKTAAARLRGRLDGLPALDVVEADAELVQATRAVQDAEEALATARVADEAAKAYAGTVRRLAEVRRELADLGGRRANNAALLPEADKIRHAATRTAELREKLVPEVDAEIAAITAQIATIDGQRRETVARWEAAQRQAEEARKRIVAADRMLASEAEVTKAAASLEGLRVAIEQTAAEEAAAKEYVDALSNGLIDGAGKRIGGLRAGLAAIGTEPLEARAIATRTLAEDDAAKVEIETGPTRLATARAQLADGAQLLRRKREDLVHVERIAARAGEIEAARAAKATAAEELATAEHSATQHEEIKAELEPQKKALADELAEKNFVRSGYATEIGGLAVDARRAPHLENATARLAEIEPQIAKLQVEKLELEAIPAVDVATDHVAQAETRVAACRARRERSMLEAEQAKKTADERAKVTAELADIEDEVADFALLADSLGKDGLQTAAIDAATPELTALSNDLLHSCHGSRFTTTISATRASADGKRELTGISVNVLDTEKGRDGAGETYSGGEKVILNTAISFALTFIGCRQSGAEGPTLVRDESGAALSPKNGRAWIAMLRRGGQMVGASKILFVSHDPELWALADDRILVEDGRVTLAPSTRGPSVAIGTTRREAA